MENTLNFIESYTIAQFKELKDTSSIAVKKNTETDKLFMVDEASNILGAVSSTITKDRAIISKVSGDDGEFFLMHNKSNSESVMEF